MEKDNVLRILYWFVFGLVIMSFYVGLRSEEYKLEYTGLALVFWGIAYYLNRLMKKDKQN